MKKLFIIIFFTLSYFILQAQPATILPDTLNINGHYTLGLDLVPLANKEFAIITKDNNDPFATFTKIDSMGTLISNSSSQPFGNNKIILSASNCMMQLKNKNWLRTAFVQTSGIVDNYNGLIVFNETLTDTVYTRLSRFNFLGTPRNSAYGWATYSRDSNSICSSAGVSSRRRSPRCSPSSKTDAATGAGCACGRPRIHAEISCR